MPKAKKKRTVTRKLARKATKRSNIFHSAISRFEKINLAVAEATLENIKLENQKLKLQIAYFEANRPTTCTYCKR